MGFRSTDRADGVKAGLVRAVGVSNDSASRMRRPEDIAAACLYLASEEASFVTGQYLVADGGMTIKMIYV